MGGLGDHIFSPRAAELGRSGICLETLVDTACKVFKVLGPVLRHIFPMMTKGGI